jgi:nitroreductase
MSADSEYVQTIMRATHQLPEHIAVQRGTAYDKFLKTDFALYDNERAMFEWACRQTYIAAGNMMTSASLIGIDSCPIEGFHKRQVEQVLSSEGLLDTDTFGVSCMLAFGYRLHQPREKTRQTTKQIVQWI